MVTKKKLDSSFKPTAYRLQDPDTKLWVYYTDDELCDSIKSKLEPLYDQATIDVIVVSKLRTVNTIVET